MSCLFFVDRFDLDAPSPPLHSLHLKVSKSHQKPGLLTYPTASCWAVLELAVRWSSRSERSGALRDASAKQACAQMLEALVHILAADGNFSIPLYFYEGWVLRWPRPDGQPPSIRLDIAADGTFSFAGWAEALRALPPLQAQVGTSWLRALQLSLGASARFADTFTGTMGSKKFRALHAQLLWHCGLRLQALLQSSLQGRKTIGFECVPWKMLDLLDQPYQLDKFLARYVDAAQRRWHGRIHYNLCTDKASVGGLSLQNTMVCTPDGVAVMAPPQVRFPAAGGRLRGVRGGVAQRVAAGPQITLGDVIRVRFFGMSRVLGIT